MNRLTREEDSLSYIYILRFWLPLAFMWLVMGLEQPAISAIVTRLPQAKESLAAFEVAFGLAALIHSPIVQMLSAATALVKGAYSYRRLQGLLWRLVLFLSSLHLLIALPPVFGWVCRSLLNIPGELIPKANMSFLLFLPITWAVGFRRMQQGALIRAGKSGIVSAIMLVRLTVTTLFLGTILLLHRYGIGALPGGHIIAVTAFMLGVTAGAVSAQIALVRTPLPEESETESSLSARELLRFYLPLAATSVILMLGRPLMAFAMGRSSDPVESLAAWPLIQNYIFIFSAVAHSYQEVVVAKYYGTRGRRPEVRRFGELLAGFLILLYLGLLLSGGARGWFNLVMGVPEELLPYVMQATSILIPFGLLVALFSIEAGSALARRRTEALTAATVINVGVQILLGISLPVITGWNGARIAGTIAVSANLCQLCAIIIINRLRDAKAT